VTWSYCYTVWCAAGPADARCGRHFQGEGNTTRTKVWAAARAAGWVRQDGQHYCSWPHAGNPDLTAVPARPLTEPGTPTGTRPATPTTEG
jgi:hypothetical protein